MKQSIFAILISGVVLTSCGTSKKLKSKDAEIANLNSQMATMNTKMADCDKQVTQLKAENIQYGNEAEDCRKAKEALAKRYENIQKNLAEKGTSMKQIQQKIQAAVSKFEDEGATVTYKNGLVHVNYTEDFFFKSGSSNIGVRGREALNTVAEVLRENQGITCIIVGNTDTISVRGVADNWSLSTERANAVVRVLHDIYNINPKRLTAAGKSKFDPVASNDTEDGRKRNRRIEIIFNPDLSRLWELMED